jgi:hypothetical protein
MKESTQVSGSIEIMGDCAYYRPAGQLTLDEAIDLVDQTIARVRDKGISKLLFNGKALVGFPPPSLPTRYFAIRRFAETGKGLVQLAMVIQAGHIDPEKFGVMVARNSGFNADVFSEEKEAFEWLQHATGS